MRQAVVQHERVRIKDMTKEKRKKKSAAEQDAEAKMEEEVVRISLTLCFNKYM
jgi:hypothetical protein